MKKAYYLLFYKIYNFFKSISDDGWSDWKALVIVSAANCIILLVVDLFIKVFFKAGFILELPKIAFIILFSIISVAHYYYFLHNNRWKEYEEEFKNYSVRKNKMAGWLVFLFLITVLGSLIFAFYQMSLIDWSKYRK